MEQAPQALSALIQKDNEAGWELVTGEIPHEERDRVAGTLWMLELFSAFLSLFRASTQIFTL